jgi:formate-dependent nitrite reductase membrane component NrfD
MTFDADLIFVIGLIVGVLAIPALLSAFSESRAPRAAAIMVMISAGLVATAILQKPGGYTVEEAPDVFFSVVARLVG